MRVAWVLGCAWALAGCGDSPPSNALHAVATVTHLSGGKCTWLPDSGELCPKLEMRVHPTQGAPYPVHVEARIPEIAAARVQPGAWIAVLVDPADPARVFVDVPALGTVAPHPPDGAAPLP